MYSSKYDRKYAVHKMKHIQRSAVYDNKNKMMEKGETNMTKTMKIEGMMCGHCEARVKKCLEALDEVTEAVVSHESGTAVLTLNTEISDELLKKTVEEQDYKVVTVE